MQGLRLNSQGGHEDYIDDVDGDDDNDDDDDDDRSSFTPMRVSFPENRVSPPALFLAINPIPITA